MNSKLLTLILIILGLFLAALFLQRGEVLWLAFPFLAYITIGLIKFPALDTINLHASRQLHQINLDGQPKINVEVIICNQGSSLPCVQVIDSRPKEVMDDECKVGLTTSLATDDEASLMYALPVKRGQYAWKSTQVRISDPFHLLTNDLDVPAPAELSIHPERENLFHLPVRPHYTLHAPGSIPASRAGSGTDFWDVRLYHPGDSLRWLDWRLNARHPGQFFTREFEQEEVADIGLILDARSETDQIMGGESLFEYSVRAAASLAESFIHQGNRVSLLAFGKRILRVFPGYGKHQLHRILDALSESRTSSPGRILGLHYLPLEMFSNRSLLIVFSPLTRADRLFFLRLLAGNYQSMLISPDPYDFIYPTAPRDGDCLRGFFLARHERRIQLQSIARLKVNVIDWQVSQPLFPLVRAALGHARGHGESKAYYGA